MVSKTWVDIVPHISNNFGGSNRSLKSNLEAHCKTLEKDLQIKLEKKKQVRNVVLKHAKKQPGI